MSCASAFGARNGRRDAIAVPGLARVACVQGGDVRARFEQRQHVPQGEDRARLGPERLVDGDEELVVLEIVNRPPMGCRVVEPGLPGDVVNPETVAAVPDERRRVLTFMLLGRL